MPISEIGKESGFTLIEVLAIIILIGFMALLIFPSFSLGQEGTEIRFIGQLITGDIKQVKEEALFSKTELVMEFTNDGYGFQIGEADIRRSFQKYQFSFDIYKEEEEESAEEKTSEETGSENDAATDENGSPTVTETPTAEDSGESDSAAEESDSALTFAGDGSVSALDLKWETTHYQGTLRVKEDGTVEWHYERK